MVWELPVLWVCENNQYGMGTAVERASAVSEIREKAEGYGMPNARIDGMDILQVRAGTEKALKHVREKGPYFLEIITYRFLGHSMGDPERYRESDEVQKWRDDDPIGIFRKYLLENELYDVATLDVEDDKVEQKITQAVEFAERSPDPEPEALYEDIYVDD
jgi:pyruvate dehydrogenase E1 component alpha subunit